MVLLLLAVEEVGLVQIVLLSQSRSCYSCQRDTLVSRAEHGVKLIAQSFMDQTGIELAQGCQLLTGTIVAGVDKIGGVPTALGYKVAEPEHIRAHHKLNKLSFGLRQHHNKPPLQNSKRPKYSISRLVTQGRIPNFVKLL